MEKINVVFISGTGRSGSTVLDLVLTALNRRFFSVGESVALLHHSHMRLDDLCNCGQQVASCDFWSQVIDETFGGLQRYREMLDTTHRWTTDILSVPAQLSLAARTLAPSLFPRNPKLTDLLYRYFVAMKRHSGCDIIVDSSKFPEYGYALVNTPNIHVSVLHMVRDPRAVAYSWQRVKRRVEVTRQPTFFNRRKPAKVALKWNEQNGNSSVLGRVADRYLRMRYEDMVADPQQALERILRWLDCPAPVNLDEVVIDPGRHHSMSGNPMRFGKKGITIKADMEWKQKLPAKDKAVVTGLTWPLLLAYGYDLKV